MNYKNKKLEELGKKINNLKDQDKNVVSKKESGAGFGF